MEGIILFFFMMACYFLPLIIAISRKHGNTLAIGMLNLFLGWTVLGWIGALIWACTSNKTPQVVVINEARK